jgi:hypothetical protein
MSVFNVTQMGDEEPELVVGALEAAASEFDRRAMLPQYGELERCRIFACATWLRDMAREINDDQKAEWERMATAIAQRDAAFVSELRKRRNRPSQLDG